MTALGEWPALVLTAGLGTRLRPLSFVRAKAAMPVAGRPIISRILDWLRGAGVRRVVINLHHRPETITRIVGDGAEWGLAVRYSWEPTVLGSAGGPRRALPLLDSDRFLIVNGDTLTDCNLEAVAERHHTSGALVTMAVVEGDVQRYGGVLVDSSGVVRGFGRSGSGNRALHFIGVQAAQSAAFERLADSEPAETVRALYPTLIAARPGALVAFESQAEFLDVGTPHDYLRTVEIVAAREGCPFDRGEGTLVDRSAVLDRSVLWDRVHVGANSRLSGCVVADDVEIPPNRRYDNAVIVQASHGPEITPL